MANGRTILLVEPDRGTLRVLSDALHAAGFTVVADDGAWAPRVIEKRHVDLVIANPATAMDFARDLRKRGRKLPIVFLSAAPLDVDALGDRVDVLDRKAPPSAIVDNCKRALGIVDEPSEPSVRRRRRERARVEAHSRELASVADFAEAKGVESDSQVRFRGAALVRGNLEETPFSEVIAELHRWRATGSLLVEQPPVKKVVWFHEGAPSFVRSNVLGEALGQVLVREKFVSAKECEAALERMKTSKLMLGTELIRAGRISPANLAYALQLQLENKLFDLFSWTDGAYRFNPRDALPDSQVRLEMTCAKVLLEGIRRTVDDARAAELVGDALGLSVRLSDDPMNRFQEMGLDAEEALFYAAIDGKKTVGELLAKTTLPRGDALRLLYALQCASMIQLGEPLPFHARLAPEAPAAPVSADELASRAEKLREATLYEALGVPRAASDQQIRDGFEKLARELHPDRLARDASAEVRALAEDLFHELTSAQEILLDHSRRAQYDKLLAAGTKSAAPQGDITRIVSASAKFREGEVLLKAGHTQQARTSFEEAVKLWPKAAEFHAGLGWSIWLTEADETLAMAALDKALELDPRTGRAYLYRGRLAKALGLKDEAQAEFEKALLCNPADAEALAEIE